MSVAIGQVDNDLSGEVSRPNRVDNADKWEPSEDTNWREYPLYDKYKRELYAILCSLTVGEPKQMVRGVDGSTGQQDGFKAFVTLNH